MRLSLACIKFSLGCGHHKAKSAGLVGELSPQSNQALIACRFSYILVVSNISLL